MDHLNTVHMERTLPLLLLVHSFSASSQFWGNDFEGSWGSQTLPIILDTAAADIWEIGPPQKTFFHQTISGANVLVTDTIAPYPAGNTSRFLVNLPLAEFQWWPEFFLHFYQTWDMDSLHAGGIIEVSYDTGATWMNVFEDWVNPPNIEMIETGVGYIEPDTLSNGEIGFTGRTGDTEPNWVWSSFCWVNGGLPMPDTLRLRFTFYSDSLAAPADGWMLDDFQFDVGFVHPVSEFLKQDDFLQAAPNPMTDRLHIRFDIDEPEVPVRLGLYDQEGRLVRSLMDGTRYKGMHNLTVWRKDLGTAERMLFLKADIGGRRTVKKIVLAGD